MARRSKRDKPELLIRKLLAENVRDLRDDVYAGEKSETAKNRKLAEKADTTLSQIQRVLSSDLGTSIDLLARIARALKCRPEDLITPYYATTIGRPQAEPSPDALDDSGTETVLGIRKRRTR
jgi:hypothetical protein